MVRDIHAHDAYVKICCTVNALVAITGKVFTRNQKRLREYHGTMGDEDYLITIYSCIMLLAQRGHCILFSVVFTPSPPSRRGSVWVLPVISNTVSRVCMGLPNM
jgi:hypothetical protein